MATWLDIDPECGWRGGTVKTYWHKDPAIDQERSNIEAYKRDLEKKHLQIKPGCQPVEIEITHLTTEQLHSVATLFNARDQLAACVAAFRLGVRIKSVKAAEPELEGGFYRLPDAFVRALSLKDPEIIPYIGSWLTRQAMLTDDEKKASLQESGPQTSSKQEGESMTAQPATNSDGAGKAAQI